MEGIIRGKSLEIGRWIRSCSDEGDASFELSRFGVSWVRSRVAWGDKTEEGEADGKALHGKEWRKIIDMCKETDTIVDSRDSSLVLPKRIEYY